MSTFYLITASPMLAGQLHRRPIQWTDAYATDAEVGADLLPEGGVHSEGERRFSRRYNPPEGAGGA